MTFTFGSVALGSSRATFEAQPRFVALMDVLGAKRWVEHAKAANVASALDRVIEASAQAASGELRNGGAQPVPIEPLVGTSFFSDCLIAYSVDDSWASFVVLGDFVGQLLQVALNEGIPFRGAISLGDIVIDRSRGLFIGEPLADAYKSDQENPYRGVGVHVTAAALSQLQARSKVEEIPLHYRGIGQHLFHGIQAAGEHFMWYAGSLFVDHWGPEFTAGCKDLEQRDRAYALLDRKFLSRGLPEDETVRNKRAQSRDFLLARLRQGAPPSGELPAELWVESKRRDLAVLADKGLRDGSPSIGTAADDKKGSP